MYFMNRDVHIFGKYDNQQVKCAVLHYIIPVTTQYTALPPVSCCNIYHHWRLSIDQK